MAVGPVRGGQDTLSPGATVAICSRNRPRLLRRAVESVVRMVPASVPVLVIDQSDQSASWEDLVADAPQSDGPDPDVEGLAERFGERIDYHRDAGRGLARAQNLALQLATTDVVVFVDDDCEMDEETVPALLEAMRFAPDVAIAFGTVFAERSVDARGFIPTFDPPREQILRGRRRKFWEAGISACMAVDRRAALALGGLDERLGPGTAVAACEDGEFTYRVLRAGYAVVHAPRARVRHSGRRLWPDGRRYAYQTWRGIGAACALHLRGGDLFAAWLLALEGATLLANAPGRWLRGDGRTGLTCLVGLVAGVPAGLALGPRAANARPDGSRAR